MSVTSDGSGKVMRIAMADPTDTAAVAEIEQLTHCDVEVNVLPLSAIDELVDKGYRQINTAVVSRAGNPGATMFVTSRGKVEAEAESEVSETAQIPLATLQAMGPDDLEARFAALVGLLLAKGLVTEAELAEALRKGKA
jgi:type II secretion system (T2SS) protein E